MNRNTLLSLALVLAVFGSPAARAQEKPKPPEDAKSEVPMKVQVVLSEWEGEKKISSLPYVLYLMNEYVGSPGRSASLRMGVRVPVTTTGKDGASQLQYMDVGTDLDCKAGDLGEGRFRLQIVLRRSSLYSTGPDRKSLEWTPGEPVPALAVLGGQPILRNFNTSAYVLMRDGQTTQATLAADPVSGRLLKVDVTLNVLK